MGIAIFAAARMVQAVPAWLDLHWPQLGRATTAAQTHERQAHRPGAPRAQPAAPHRVARLAHRLLGRLASAASRSDRLLTERGPLRAGAAKPLRVLRVIEPHQARNAAGRMVISGRMADVCAELDRLAAAEAACGADGR